MKKNNSLWIRSG